MCLFQDFSAKIEYNATTEQVVSLIDHSGSCYQDIKFKCIEMPLHVNDTDYGYWKDRKGFPRHFYDGSGGRNCSCEDDECEINQCHCDVSPSSGAQEDKGRITSDWILPITEIGYRFYTTWGWSHSYKHNQNGSATFIIGDLVCKGKQFRTKSLPDSFS